MDCAALISTASRSLGAESTVGEAARLLAESGGEAVAVCGADRRYIGLFGLGELFALLVPRVALAGDISANVRFVADDLSVLTGRYSEIAALTLGDWCDRDAVTLAAGAPAAEALRLFFRGHRALPVLDGDGRFLGLITGTGALGAIAAA